MEIITYTKPQKRVLSELAKIPAGCGSPAMVADNLALKVSTVDKHLKSLKKIGAVSSSQCNLHRETTVYELTPAGSFWLV